MDALFWRVEGGLALMRQVGGLRRGGWWVGDVYLVCVCVGGGVGGVWVGGGRGVVETWAGCSVRMTRVGVAGQR